MNHRLSLFFGAWLVAATAYAGGGANRYARDPKLLEIRQRQDERAVGPLLNFLHDPNPTYRAEAARAFASVLAPEARGPLTKLVQTDPAPPVRAAAAHALGLLADTLTQADLLPVARQEADPTTRAAVLEALGRVATLHGGGARFLAEDPLPRDSVALAGWAWGMYRAASRRVLTDGTVGRAVQLLAPHQPRAVRVAAAHLLARTPKLDLTAYADELLAAAQHDSVADVRIPATQALGRVSTPQAADVILRQLCVDPDPRVRVAALRAATSLRYDQVAEAAWGALADASHNVQVAAADYLLQKAPADEPAAAYRQRALQRRDPQVRATLLATALRLSTQPDSVRRLVGEVEARYALAPTPTQKAFLLRALGQSLAAWEFIAQQTLAPLPQPIVGAAGAEALVMIRSRADFPKDLTSRFADLFRQALGTPDVAIVSTIAGALRDPALNFKGAYPDLGFLRTARQRLTLPRDVETAQELDQTLAFLSGQPAPVPVRTPPTHPTNWELVKKLPDHPRVTVTTNRGVFVMELLLDEAPASVATLAELIDRKFYDNLLFHRVVPDFVVQGGDPRGDGSGGLDYTLRSELSAQSYTTGAVGLASAGLNTESCQWFVMHCPAPHLDGRYTLFARVVQGQAVVDQLRVGDVMTKVRLK